jgi:hypothetical protein
MTPTPIRSFGELVMRHKGERICVMGGGPSLAHDLDSVKADVWISVNEHGAKLRPADYVVCMDDVHTKKHVHMLKHLRQFTDAPIISPWHWGEWQLSTWPRSPFIPLSGVVASWVAYLMGAHPVIMAGFDCHGGHGATLGQHRSYLPFVKAEVRVVSGPLTQMYPAYVAGERRKPYVPPEVFTEHPEFADEIKVRVRKRVAVRGLEWPVGTELVVSRFEVRRQLQHKSLEVV